ncbi:hypothetical protein ACS0TY_018361 [Phlomoides rotata]
MVQQAEPQQTFQVPELGKTDSAYTSTSSKLEENKTEHQESKPDVSEQPNTSVVKEGEINLIRQTGPKQLQRPDKKTFTYIKEQETKLALVVNLTEDEISTRRALGIWVYLTEMEKVKYLFKIYQNLVNGSFLLNAMTGGTTRSRCTATTCRSRLKIEGDHGMRWRSSQHDRRPDDDRRRQPDGLYCEHILLPDYSDHAGDRPISEQE